ncbi:methyltransferase type 11 [Methyloprofundus sedimenti]|uniref:Methyltransferase type 11 n=1 Tax=Methyloprofundus sedimenti TaxID=1420851 RepID=A0A1V8M8H0_9GAMM|nr:class I SAM-dependent methyltransferase [Methyloprofundus sedimenti]OQK17806.1 methyltransferase type 11 [Methyloprofundus sedimenti]
MAKITPFEDFSEIYDDWFEKHTDKYAAELLALKCFVPANAYGLEVGVGSGKFADPLGIKIGVEPSPKMADKARKLGIQVLSGIAEDLPIQNSTFDFVLMVTTICFVDDLKKSFQEAFRVLKKDGFILIGFIDKDSELGQVYRANKVKSHFYNIAEFFSTQEVLACLKESGFGNFETKQTIFPGKDTQRIEDGFGTGSFVVIKGFKINKASK